MPNNQRKNSFIPRTNSVEPSTSDSKRSGGTIFILVSFGLFIVTVLASVGLFLYKQSVKSNLTEKQQQLEQARSSFDPALIDELSQLDNRISTAEQLLNNHLAFTPIFPIIESVTLKSVSFNSMEVAQKEEEEDSESGDTPDGNSEMDGVTVKLEGVGPGYPTIALQSSELADHNKIRNPILSDFSLNNEGNVEFSVQFTVPVEEVRYTNTNISSLQ